MDAGEHRMKERGILFSAPMVRAILAGTKTQTRRIVKHRGEMDQRDGGGWWPYRMSWSPGDPDGSEWMPCPYGQPGDRLWVRETWAHVPITAYRCSEGVQQTANPKDPDMAAVYAAGWDRSSPGRWRPSIHMPRWASRITLEITSVRVERLQEISQGDARAEGCDGSSNSMGSAFTEYVALWAKINGTEGPVSWDANPWVWVVEFKRVKP